MNIYLFIQLVTDIWVISCLKIVQITAATSTPEGIFWWIGTGISVVYILNNLIIGLMGVYISSLADIANQFSKVVLSIYALTHRV